jgi:hypothetical protein
MHHPFAVLMSIFAMMVAPALVTMRPYRAEDLELDEDE